MANPVADHWNDKYQQERSLWLEMEPRHLLVSFIDLVPNKGLALDAACGVGINAIYLANHGLRVIGIDISEYALRLAMKQVKSLDHAIDFIVADLSHPWLPDEHFDLITNFHFLERGAIPVYRKALRQGGLIMFDTFMVTDKTVDSPNYYLKPGELKNMFKGFEIIHYSEEERQPTQNRGARGTAQIVARKPASVRAGG